MSGQWEVVGKKKDRGNKTLTEKKPKEKKNNLNGVKVEDVLSSSQLKNLYTNSASQKDKENRKIQEKVVKPQTNGAPKKPPKSQDKPKENKPPKAKSIDLAFKAIQPNTLNEIFNKYKTQFPETPIVWLKEIVQHLNMNLVVDIPDPVFTNKPDHHPLSVVPSAIKTVMEKALKQAGTKNCALFFDITLTSMGNDMNKNLNALGHKLFLQYLAINNPTFSTSNVNKYVQMIQSYQNRPNIALSILWALGHAGNKNLAVGLKVFQDIMYPFIETKNYSHFVIKYLINLIKKHSEDGSITREQYLYLTNIIYSNRKNSHSDLNKELNETVPLLNEFVTRNSDKHYTFIEPFLKKIAQTQNKAFKNNLCHVLMVCLEKDANCLGTWGKIYVKHLPGSAVLLTNIEQNWKTASTKINKKAFCELLKTYTATNDELLLKKKKEEGLNECVAAVKKLQNRMAHKTKKARFPYKLLTFLAFVICGLLVLFDVKHNGSWHDSKTLKMLNQSGVCDYTHKALDRAKEGTLWVHSRIEERFPGVTEATVEFTTPYIELGRDLCIIVSNMAGNVKIAIMEKIPIICDTIDSYAPGLLEQTQKAANDAWTNVVYYTEQGKEYLMKEVFVGKMAPEEMKKFVELYTNQFMKTVTEYYHWVYEKIATAIK